jgi:acetylornithine deacetylase/succinyl-diaminopimelate desuccinylase-like protein
MATIDEYLHGRQENHLEELCAFLRIPSISTDPARRADVGRAADFLASMMRAAGLRQVEIVPTAGHPAVYGEWLGAPGRPTALVYGHYDVQPVDPLGEWQTPPFEPSVRGDELYARGAVDDKGQVFMQVKAIEALLQTTGALPMNVKFIVEGEEEMGSDNLDALLRERAARLSADVVVISDTAMFARGLPSLCYGLRGITYLQADVSGPDSDLHSGVFGGAVDNPAQVLAELIGSLKDRHGRINVPGFYDAVAPLTDAERAAWAALPFDEDAYIRSLGVPALFGEEGYTTLERAWGRPTLEINGIWGGFTGEGSKTIIPARASAKISCRLVPDQDPQTIAGLLERHLRTVCPRTVTLEVTHLHDGRPWRMPLDHPALAAAGRAVARGFGMAPVFTREGGSIPVVATLESLLRAPTLLVGIGLPDEHAHAPNERLHLPNLWNGMRTVAYLWEELAALER